MNNTQYISISKSSNPVTSANTMAANVPNDLSIKTKKRRTTINFNMTHMGNINTTRKEFKNTFCVSKVIACSRRVIWQGCNIEIKAFFRPRWYKIISHKTNSKRPIIFSRKFEVFSFLLSLMCLCNLLYARSNIVEMLPMCHVIPSNTNHPIFSRMCTSIGVYK